jgi:eukaryotic-like serine/threonine-protein kinase
MVMTPLGQHIGNYRLLHLVGCGGFAEVYLAEQRYLKTLVAIKVLRAPLTEQNRASFLREAQVIAHLRHPHIVRVLDFGIDDASDRPFLIMDYAACGTVRQRHPKGRPVPPEAIVSYVKQIASALHFAYTEKLVHRDIKPENVLLGSSGEILLSDFGIAVAAHTTASLRTQDISGTVNYMAPEQLQGKPRPASDQYALGIVVYEWLCGFTPFYGDSFAEIAIQHLSSPPRPLPQTGVAFSLEVERVVFRALSKDPHQRYASVQEFADALEQAIDREGKVLSTPLLTYEGHAGKGYAVAWAPFGKRIASGSDDGTIQIWDALTGYRQLTYRGHRAPVYAVAWSPYGGRLASGGEAPSGSDQGEVVQVWEAHSGRLLLTYSGHAVKGQTGSIHSVAWSPDGELIASSSWFRSVRVWNATSGQTIMTVSRPDFVRAIAWSPDSKQLAIAVDKTVQIREVATGRIILTYSGHSDIVTAVAWSSDGSRLVSGAYNSVQIWEAATGRLVISYEGPTEFLAELAWSPDGRRIALASYDKTVRVLDARTGRCQLIYVGYPDIIEAARWSPDGKCIALTGYGRTVHLWQTG